MLNRARVKRKTYIDSITLMKLARALTELEGIEEAAVLMGTSANKQLLTEVGLSPFAGPLEEPQAGDIVIVVRAVDEFKAEAALEVAESRLLDGGVIDQVHANGSEVTQMNTIYLRSVEEAQKRFPQASVAVISVPGTYAALEAEQAIRSGLHVFLFSDNVSLDEEVALKRLGEERGLLVMGPDCGTARLNGIGLGFVNVVADGPIGIVGASGTGMQQVMSLIAQAGSGISQAIGCGGRDLSVEVGAVTTLRGLRLLQEDLQTRVIVLISKPPAPDVAKLVLSEAAKSEKPVVVIFVGATLATEQHSYGPQVTITSTLTEAAEVSVALSRNQHPSVKKMEQSDEGLKRGMGENGPFLVALFSGGTLCDEALHLWGERPGPIYSNVPLRTDWQWHTSLRGQGHYALDLGADEYTRGRPHPMIDPEARLSYLRDAFSHPNTGVILLDLVLGYCSHPDPASVYAPIIYLALQEARQHGRAIHCVISLCGTEGDPQRLSRQETMLREAGAEVFTSNAVAALRCLELLNDLQEKKEE